MDTKQVEKQTPVKTTSPLQVSKKTLKKLIIFHEVLVRPIKQQSRTLNDNMFMGEIIKMPEERSASEYEHGESWKALLEKESRIKVGDKILYCGKYNIVLDGELLHMVGYIAGKILE